MSRALLDPSFLSELEALRRRLEIDARSGQAGDRAARRRGGAAEFQEHRPYADGDDPRRIDWLAYARTGTPFVKVFRTEEDVVVRTMVDVSASMGHGTPPKLEVAKKLAAAMAYMALASSERAQLVAAASGITAMPLPSRGRGGLVPFLRELEKLRADGSTDLAHAIEQLRKRSLRPGLLAVFSDFFDPGPVLDALSRARAQGHDVRLVQILAPDELEPSLEGDYALEDVETGELVDITMDASAIEAYARRLAGLFEELRATAKRLGASYVLARTDEPLEAVVRRIVAGRVD